MELHYLEIFNTVSRYESYRKASDEMHISQPALSTEIKRLEQQIGLKLFDRAGNGVVLNQNGIMLQQYTKQIFSVVGDMETAIADKKNYVGGTLQIGASNTPGAYIMPVIMAGFCQKYPEIMCNLSVGNTSEIADAVSHGELDIAVNGGDCSYDSRVSAKVIYVDKLVLVAAPGHNMSVVKGNHTHDALAKEKFIVHKANSQLYAYYERFATSLSMEQNIAMMLGSIDAIKSAVRANIGIALLPGISVKNELDDGKLISIKLKNLNMDYPYNLIYNKDKALTTADRKFAEYIMDNISFY